MRADLSKAFGNEQEVAAGSTSDFPGAGIHSPMRPYLTLALAIAAEVTGTTALNASDGFTELLPSVVVVAGYVGSFYLLGLTLESLAVGLVYATWAGIGIVATALVGVLVFGEPIDGAAVVGFALVVAGVVVLNVFSETYAPAH